MTESGLPLNYDYMTESVLSINYDYMIKASEEEE